MMNYTEDNMTLDLATVNSIPHCPVIMVLDTSHSMWGPALADMMVSIKAFYKSINEYQFQNAEIDIAAVSMGDNLCLLEDFTPLGLSDLPNRSIRPKGDTPIGAALELALNTLDEQIRKYQSTGTPFVTPNLVMLSDGKSTDDFHQAAEQIRTRVGSGNLICRAVALGNDADMETLSRIAGNDNVAIPNFGEMRHTFAQIGQMVSQTYNEEALEIITEQAAPANENSEIEYLLDGSNILYWDQRSPGVTLNCLLAITEHLKQENKSFLVLFDATAPHKLEKDTEHEADLYKKLLNDDPAHFLQVPGGTRADDFILMMADKYKKAVILTNDRFQDHVDKYPWLATDENRLHKGMVAGNFIMFPTTEPQIFINLPENDNINSL